MIDLLNAQKEFKNYLKDYNIEDERVKLKVTHTYGVVDASRYLSNKLNLNEEDTKLSELIALLHDIGRFEQSKVIENVFDKADTKYFDHAKFGVKILFEDNLIRKFIADSSYDNIIYKAILNHNKYKIEDNLNEKELLHAKLIRDNDKTDNFRVKLTEQLSIILGTEDMEKIYSDTISDKIYEDFMNKKQLKIDDRKTYLDSWVSYISFIFDYNFSEGLMYLKENDLVNKMFDKIKYKNSETIERICNMRIVANEYLVERIKNSI